MQERATRKIVGSVGWAGLEATWSVLVSVVVLLGIARLIGAAEFGLGALALGIVGMVGVVTSLLHDALVRSPSVTKQHFDSAWTATLLLSILSVLICMALAAPLTAFFREPRFSAVFLSFSVALIPEAAAVPFLAERRREMDFRLVALQNVAARSLGAACGLGCALAGLGVWSMVAQQWATNLIRLAVMLIYSPLRPGLRLEIDCLRPLVRFGSPIVLTQFVMLLGPRLILIYIGRTGDLALAGYWGLATRMVGVLQQVTTRTLYHVALSQFAKVEQRTALGGAVREANVWLATIVFPGLILFVVIGPDIIEFLLGQAWLPAAPAVQILAVGVMVRLRFLLDRAALNALGRSEIGLGAYSIELVALAAALFLLAPESLLLLSIVAATLPLIGYCVVTGWSLKLTGRSVTGEYIRLLLDLTMAAVTGLVVWYVHLSLADQHVLVVLLASALSATGTAVCVMAVLHPVVAMNAWSALRARANFPGFVGGQD